jgi:Ca2+-binding EF-hand superfamily protein
MIDRLDSDEDGLVSADEFRGPEDRFDELDTNDDGQISEGELSSSMEANLTETFDELDANDDGFISEDERPQKPSPGDVATGEEYE